jgi:hypothetical protein
MKYFKKTVNIYLIICIGILILITLFYIFNKSLVKENFKDLTDFTDSYCKNLKQSQPYWTIDGKKKTVQ